MSVRHLPRHRGWRTPIRAACLLALVAALGLAGGPFGATTARANSPVLTLTPDRGTCSTPVTARGTGYPAGKTIDFITKLGANDGLGSLPSTTAAADGTFTFTLDLPFAGCAGRAGGETPLLIGTSTGNRKAGAPVVELASATFTITATAAEPQGQLTLSVDCATNPEAATIGNQTDQTLDLSGWSLGSLAEPQAGEPFSLDIYSGRSEILRVGAFYRYETGAGARVNVLTSQELYDDDALEEGGAPDHPFGTFTVLCSERSRTFSLSATKPVLTLDPDRGPCATPNPAVTARGADFPADATVTLRVGRLGGNNFADVTTATVAPDGSFAVPLSLVGCSPQERDGAQFGVFAIGDGGTLLAQSAFTVTAEQCFAETGQCVRGHFLEYWQSRGLDLGDAGVSYRESLALFGHPISDEFEQTLEDGNTYTVQYFERVRLEHHPENAAPYDVLLGQFGRRLHPADPTAPAEEGYTYFPETGHNVGPRFFAYWQAHGGLEQFGYPLSEVFEQQLEDGNTYQVQYFERARFELHPENAGTDYEVLLGQFGRRILAESTPRTLALEPTSGHCAAANPEITVRGSGFTPGVVTRFVLTRDRDGAVTAASSQSGGRPANPDGSYAITLTLAGCGPDEPAGSTFTVTVFEYTPDRAPASGPSASATFTVTEP